MIQRERLMLLRGADRTASVYRSMAFIDVSGTSGRFIVAIFAQVTFLPPSRCATASGCRRHRQDEHVIHLQPR